MQGRTKKIEGSDSGHQKIRNPTKIGKVALQKDTETVSLKKVYSFHNELEGIIHLHTRKCAYQRVRRNVSFSENFAYILNE